jgi:hypothetical protein
MDGCLVIFRGYSSMRLGLFDGLFNAVNRLVQSSSFTVMILGDVAWMLLILPTSSHPSVAQHGSPEPSNLPRSVCIVCIWHLQDFASSEFCSACTSGKQLVSLVQRFHCHRMGLTLAILPSRAVAQITQSLYFAKDEDHDMKGNKKSAQSNVGKDL